MRSHCSFRNTPVLILCHYKILSSTQRRYMKISPMCNFYHFYKSALFVHNISAQFLFCAVLKIKPISGMPIKIFHVPSKIRGHKFLTVMYPVLWDILSCAQRMSALKKFLSWNFWIFSIYLKIMRLKYYFNKLNNNEVS